MEFSISRDVLQSELGLLAGIARKDKAIPALSFVLIDAHSGGITFSVTNRETWLRTTCKVTADRLGTILVPAHRLNEMVRSMVGSTVSVSLDSHQRLTIVCNKTRFVIPGESPDSFPIFPDLPNQPEIEIDSAVLSRLCRLVNIAVSTKATNVPAGAKVMVADQCIAFAGTDGYRVASIKHAIDSDASWKAIIPKSPLNEIPGLVLAGKSYLRCTENHLFIRSGTRMVVSALLAAAYPNTDNIISASGGSLTMTVEAAILSAIIKRVRLGAEEEGQGIRFDLSTNMLRLSASRRDTSAATEELGVVYDGPDVSFAANASFMTDFLSLVSDQNVTVRLSENISSNTVPLLISTEQEEGSQYYALVPMRLDYLASGPEKEPPTKEEKSEVAAPVKKSRKSKSA